LAPPSRLQGDAFETRERAACCCLCLLRKLSTALVKGRIFELLFSLLNGVLFHVRFTIGRQHSIPAKWTSTFKGLSPFNFGVAHPVQGAVSPVRDLFA
jgi:hypothetical protein